MRDMASKSISGATYRKQDKHIQQCQYNNALYSQTPI